MTIYLITSSVKNSFNTRLFQITDPIPETFINAPIVVFESSSRIFTQRHEKSEQFLQYFTLNKCNIAIPT